jgi:hypothetical protein
MLLLWLLIDLLLVYFLGLLLPQVLRVVLEFFGDCLLTAVKTIGV